MTTWLGLGVGEWTFVGLAPLCALAERLAPRVPEPSVLTASNGRRLVYLGLRAGLGALATIALLALIAAWPVGWGLTAARVPFAAQCAIMLVVIDGKQYARHRAAHRFAWLWRFHKVHHAVTSLNWLATAQSHLLDELVLQLGSSVLVTWLLGADPAAYLLGAGVPAMVFGALGAHLNVDLPRGRVPWWARVVNTPNVHGHHHARRLETANLGEVFVLWDVLFGTFEAPSATPREFGLAGEPEFPIGIVAAQLSPFRRSSAGRRPPAA